MYIIYIIYIYIYIRIPRILLSYGSSFFQVWSIWTISEPSTKFRAGLPHLWWFQPTQRWISHFQVRDETWRGKPKHQRDQRRAWLGIQQDVVHDLLTKAVATSTETLSSIWFYQKLQKLSIYVNTCKRLHTVCRCGAFKHKWLRSNHEKNMNFEWVFPGPKPYHCWLYPHLVGGDLTMLKNISEWEGWHPIYYGKTKKCSKPPTSHMMSHDIPMKKASLKLAPARSAFHGGPGCGMFKAASTT